MTLRYQIMALVIMAIFYSIYIGKMLMQRKQGIVTNQIAKDKSNKGRYTIEKIMKIATYAVIVAELISIFVGKSLFRYSGKTAGFIIGLIGDCFFFLAVYTMGESWRAGVAADEHRKFVHNGIFKISRNPAFVGFDLVYISILLMFFNWFLCVLTIFPMVMLHLQILQEEKYLAEEFGQEYLAYKKKISRYFGLRNWIFRIGVIVLLLAVGLVVVLVLKYKSAQLPNMSAKDCICYTAKGNTDAVITVGIYKDGETEIQVYGANGEVLDPSLHTYEIGSLTKTITAGCIEKAIEEGKLSLSDTIDQYLDLPEGKKYPTIEALLTHTSGYKGYYLNLKMVYNGIIGGAPFRYVTAEQILKEAGRVNLTAESYDWNYSNFGYALLGCVLEEVYDDYYVAIVNQYLQDLGMKNTAFRQEQGDLGKCWKWELRDAYASAGAVKSNIEDMLLYAKLQLEDESFEKTHEILCEISSKNASYQRMGIHMDGIGMAWITDNTNGFVWHNGGTDDYNSYLGICKETNTAVVVLSNLPSDYRIPATVIGVKLLQEMQSIDN